jgi:hypothetical protein
MKNANLRLVSFALALIFTQKLGLGLWLHNWLHEPPANHLSVIKHTGSPGLELQPVKCTCIDDALMPLIHSNPLTYQGYQKHLAAFLLTRSSSPGSLNDKTSPALRGPPSAEHLS